MKKKYVFVLIALLCFVVSGFGQISESFETGMPTSYTNGNINLTSGTWVATQIIRGTTGVNSGSYSCQIRSQTGSQITSPVITTGGLGTVTFYASGTTASPSVQVNYRINGGAWVPATGSPFSLSSTITQYVATVNNSSANIEFQFYRTAGTIYIDDVSTTTYASCTDAMDFANIQFPTASPQTITVGDNFDVYARTYEPSVTEAAGPGAGVTAWIGYNTTNDNPNNAGWTWIPATFNTQAGNNDEFTAEIGSALTPGTYYYASRFELNSCGTYVYGGTGGLWNNDSVQLIVQADQVNFCNVDFPKTGNITTGDNFNVYAQAYEPGVTDAVGQGANIEAWIGYNTTGIDYEPWQTTGWTWIAASYDSDFGNNDQYTAEIGSALSAGTYYYASRFRLNGSEFSYGGIQNDNNGNFWTLGSFNNGTLNVTTSPCSELMISEYVEGSSSNKYIEIYNPTNTTINLSGYSLVLYSNGSSTASSTEILAGTIPAYGTIVYSNSSATIYGGPTTNTPVCNFNGDDAVALLNGSNYIDIIGTIGQDPGTAWTGTGGRSTENRTIRRNSTVLNGITTNPATGFPTFDSEWEVYNIDDISDLGNHISDCQGTTPELQLVDNTTTNQNCGFTIDFGSQALSTNTDLTFDIENVGSADLDISALGITGDYSIISPAAPLTITSGNSQTVTVRFTPTVNGTRTGILTITSNDSNEGSCIVNLTGVGFTPVPEIDVERNTFASITSGNAPNGGNNTIFASTVIGNSTAPKTYYIRNEGTASLDISSITSSNAAEFPVNTNPAPITLLPNEFVAFEITFSPTGIGTRNSTISIANNDSNENPYLINVQGNGDCNAGTLTFLPDNGPVGTIVNVTSSNNNFGVSTTATVDGIAATVLVISNNELEVTIPNGASTGSLTINDDLGCLSSDVFTVVDQLISGCEGSTGLTPTDLFISEVTDKGTGSHSYVEIYNGTGTAIDMTAGGYQLRIHNNGNSTPTASINLTGSIPNDSVIVVAFGGTNATDPEGGYTAQFFSATGGINDDDHIRLYNTADGDFDLWGDTSGNPFTVASKDYTYRRKNSGITVPSMTWNSNDWDAFTPVDYSDIGNYDFSVGTPPSLDVQPNAPTSTCDLTATISVTATEGFDGGGDTKELAYQWYYLPPLQTTWLPTTDGAIYSGSNTDTLDILNTLTLDGYQYYCEVREDDATCYTASNAVRLIAQVTEWNGTVWSNGLPDIGTVAIINGNYDTSIGGLQVSFSACHLFVYATRTLTIANNTYIEVNNNVYIDGNIIVHTQGAFVQINDLGTVSVSGNVTVEKETAPLNAWYEYTYWSSPVVGETVINGLNEASPTRRFSFNAANFRDSFYETNNDNTLVAGAGVDDIDDDGNDWVSLNDSDVMQPGIGYAATHSSIGFITPGLQYTYTFEGPFNNGIIDVPVLRNDVETGDTNWNFIGNPYASAIDVDAFFNRNVYSLNANGTLDGAIYLWSQNTAPDGTTNGNENLNFSQSDYAIINGSGENAGGDGVIPNRFIPSVQGFFVSYDDTTPSASGFVTFNNVMRVRGTNDNSQFFRTSNITENNKLRLNLTSDNGVFNQILVAYVNGATNDFDGSYYDAPRNMSTGAFSMLYSIIENSDKKFAIQGKHPNTLSLDEVIPLGFYTSITEPTIYKLSIAELEGEFLNNNTVYLKDLLLNITHDLSSSDYTFTSETGEFNERFEIVFTPETLSLGETEITPNGLTIIELENGEIKFSVGNNLTIKSVEIIDMLGRSLYQLKGNNAVELYNLSNLSQAAYIAKVNLSNGQTITKRAIKRN